VKRREVLRVIVSACLSLHLRLLPCESLRRTASLCYAADPNLLSNHVFSSTACQLHLAWWRVSGHVIPPAQRIYLGFNGYRRSSEIVQSISPSPETLSDSWAPPCLGVVSRHRALWGNQKTFSYETRHSEGRRNRAGLPLIDPWKFRRALLDDLGPGHFWWSDRRPSPVSRV
jgi:hypothetical protein